MDMTSWFTLALVWAIFATVMMVMFLHDSNYYSAQYKRNKQLLEEIRERQHSLLGDLSDCQVFRDRYEEGLICAKHRAEKAASELRRQADSLDVVGKMLPQKETKGM